MKKFLLLFALILTCLPSLKASELKLASEECEDVAMNETILWLDAGIDPAFAGCLGRQAYAYCEGYSREDMDETCS
ncbi:MAG: hypothetical protein ABJ092_12800 [Gillisia sp.]